MKKSIELQKVVDQLRIEAEQLQSNEQYDDAFAASQKLNQAINELALQKSIEAAEVASFSAGSMFAGAPRKSAEMENRIFNKMLLGRGLTADEQEYANAVGTPGMVEATPGKGGYLVPEEQIATLREYRKDYTALKNYCNVQVAHSTSGSMPTLGDEAGLLTQFDELTEIHQGDFSFGQLKYSIADYGDIIPVSNQLLADANINLMDVIGRRFARKAINTENAAILGLLATMTPAAISTYKSLMKALNVDLDPIYYANAKIFTNQDGFQWLSELSDNDARPLLVPDVAAPDTYRFRGKQVVVLSNSTLATDSAAKKIPVYVGNMADYVAFFEKAGIELAVSDQAGFTKYATLIRAVERFGVVKDDSNALKAYTISYT